MEKTWQAELARRSCVVSLVRGLLGCTCPEEIFDHYQIRRHLADGLSLVELILGERLLLWLITGDQLSDPAQILGQLLKAGLEKRNLNGLNRFRLVVVGDHLAWEKEWNDFAQDLDPKIHFHVLSKITNGLL